MELECNFEACLNNGVKPYLKIKRGLGTEFSSRGLIPQYHKSKQTNKTPKTLKLFERKKKSFVLCLQ